MEILKEEELREQLLNLKVGEQIFVSVDSSVCRTVELLNFQSTACDNLFYTYISSPTEKSKGFDLDKFTKLCADIIERKQNIFKKAMLNTFGGELYDILMSSTTTICRLDANIEKFIIMLKGTEIQKCQI